MRSLPIFLVAATLTMSPIRARAQAPTEVPADIIIPNPPPSAPAADWRDDTGRKAIALTVDGHQLRGFRYPGANPKLPDILFFNGNGMTILRTDPFYRALAAAGPSVTVYDYRGYGFTPGPAHLATFLSDGLALYDETLKQSPTHKLVVYGASMGTTVASYIASKRTLTGLILGMPIASVEEEYPVYASLMGFSAEQIASVKPSQEARDIFGEAALLKGSRVPLLVLGGADDRIVPVTQAREVFAASASSAKKFVEVPAAGHNDVITSPQALSATAAFLKALP